MWAKLAGEDGKYRIMKLESRKGAAGRVENLISVCALFGANLFYFCCKAKKKPHFELQRNATTEKRCLFHLMQEVKLPHSHSMAADENIFGLPRCCGS